MKRQRAALGMAVMMAVSSLSGSYVSASAMETWQADAEVVPEEELLAEEILEEAEPTPGAEEVPETGVMAETEAETGAAIGGLDGLQITGIEELTPEEADQLPKIELQDEEGEESWYSTGYEYSTGTSRLLPGGEMDIRTSLHYDEIDNEAWIENYTISLAGAEDGCWSSATAVVTVNNDGKTLHVKAKSLDDIMKAGEETDRYSIIPVQYFIGEEKVASVGIDVVVLEEYYKIVPEALEIENPMIDEPVDFSDLGISTEHYYLTEESSSTYEPEKGIRYRVEWDKDAWQKVPGEETVQQSKEEGSADEESCYGLPTLLRTSNRNTWIRVCAEKNFAEDGEEENWQQVDNREYWFDWVDYNSGFDFRYGKDPGSDILLYGDGSKPLTVSLNWEEMNELEVASEDIEWTVKVFEGDSENGTENLAAYGINAAVAKDGKSVTLTADNCERSDIALWVEARISKYGNELTSLASDISVAKTELFDADGLPGNDKRLVPGWPYDIDPEYQIYVRDLQHPWGEEIPIAITEAWIQDKEGAFEYTPELDENGKIIQSEYGVKLQKEDGYHLRAKQDWTKAPEGSAILTYSYELRRDPDDNTNNPEQYSGKKSVQLGVITERYDHSYRFEDGREELLPGDEAYIDTTLYYTRYDVDAGDHQEDEIKDYTVTLRQKEDGSPAWKDDLVAVSFEGTRIKVTVNKECTEWYETSIPVDYRIGDDIVYSDSIWVAISPDYYVITPERLLTEPDELGESVQMNPLVGETIDFAELDVTAWHYHRTEQGSSVEKINVDGAQFRYRMEYDSDAWVAEGPSEGEENGKLIGLRTLRRIKNGEAPVRIILEEYVEDEESGEWIWEERIGRDYWFFEADYMPALSFYYGNSETYDPYIYTEGNGLTLTFDSIASELLKAPENSEEGGKVYSLEWNVYDWDENGEQTEVKYIDISTSKDGNSITLKGKEDIDQHKGARFQVEAILWAHDEEVARIGTEISVTGPQYRFVSEPFTDSDIYLLAGSKESAQYFQKDSDGKIRLELYRKDENYPDGQWDTVLLSKIEFANREDAEKDIVHIETLDDGFRVKGGKNPGEVELKFSITDENGNSLAPVYCIAHVRTEYTAIGDWFIDSPTHAGTNLLPGQKITIKMDVYRGGIDENGTFYERKMAEDEYNVEFCDYDPDIIQIKDGVVYAKKRGETWVGVQIKDATTGYVICYEGIQVCVKGKFYSMEPVDIGTIILAPGDKSVDIPLSTIKWSISNPDGEKVTEELIYSLPEEANKRQDGFTTSKS